MSNFQVGDVARISVSVKDVSGQLADPSSIALLVKPPGAALVDKSADVVKQSVGVYYADVELTEPGSYGFRWNTYGSNQGVVEGGVFVSPNRVI